MWVCSSYLTLIRWNAEDVTAIGIKKKTNVFRRHLLSGFVCLFVCFKIVVHRALENALFCRLNFFGFQLCTNL